eukprot:CAMPEP_0170566582 /NCGR_PEP_ID=MMETSP0211-20121228/79935_1 /TAXON_ID=311385 /ORGANISM="Pseudokeronopsis sp., Strain OXSARD2" /LENGTH=30 /DNA_ID= /DNA_START= /DNA_END= /DNA_ORIENTATION=
MNKINNQFNLNDSKLEVSVYGKSLFLNNEN